MEERLFDENLRRLGWHKPCFCQASMDAMLIARQLLCSLDRLIREVTADAILVTGLCRERERLVMCLEQALGCPLTEPIRSVAQRRKMLSGGRGTRRLQPPLSLRLRCYRALAAGLLPGARFDALLLLWRRAYRTQAHSGSSSETFVSSSSGESGTGCVGEGSAGVGSPLRMYLSSTSTICA